MPKLQEDILATLAYFDMFNYPLVANEIYLFLRNKYQPHDFDNALNGVVNDRLVFRFGVFYSLKNDHANIERRRSGNKKADELIKVAERVGNILIKFPYVRGIAISGSLSKNFADDGSDIDLFIITSANRLWIARSLMHAFKKLTYLVNKQDCFCMNYYVDEQQMEIAEKNIYTAIEIVTLMPLQGDTIIEKFYAANSWTHQHLPNKIMRVSSAKPLKFNALKQLVEAIFNNGVGNAIDNLLMKITAKRWLKKTRLNKVNAHGGIMAMATGKHYAKPDPANFQARLLKQYEIKTSLILHHPESSMAQ
ncbi:nucleotidyltransferase domain-containing protein [Mucilaginibacter sp. HD30]